jgi:hypothetical protein
LCSAICACWVIRFGRNVRIDYRWGSADPARIRAHAKELVSLDPNNGLRALVDVGHRHNPCYDR